MKFLDRIFLYLEGHEELSRLRKWIAENQSCCPANSLLNLSWLPHYSGADEALCGLFLSLFLPQWETWELIERIANSAEFQEYSGRWEQVQEELEQVSSLEDLEKFVTISFSYDDFFGNFLRNCERFLRKNPHVVKPYDRDRKKPRRKVWRRGHQDKGSLRPTTLRGSFPPDPEAKEFDRKRKIIFNSLPPI